MFAGGNFCGCCARSLSLPIRVNFDGQRRRGHDVAHDKIVVSCAHSSVVFFLILLFRASIGVVFTFSLDHRCKK
jgi:hypothetical protein